MLECARAGAIATAAGPSKSGTEMAAGLQDQQVAELQAVAVGLAAGETVIPLTSPLHPHLNTH